MVVNDSQGRTSRETAEHEQRGPTALDQLVVSEHVASTAALGKARHPPQARGLPVAHLVDHAPQSTMHYAVTAIDYHGRLADRSPLRILGWLPQARVSLNTIRGELIVATRSDGPDAITRQGHLQLPASIRHACRLEPGARLLVTAFPDRGLLAAYSGSALDAMLLAYHESLRSEVA